jgi:hypothetical protein
MPFQSSKGSPLATIFFLSSQSSLPRGVRGTNSGDFAVQARFFIGAWDSEVKPLSMLLLYQKDRNVAKTQPEASFYQRTNEEKVDVRRRLKKLEQGYV